MPSSATKTIKHPRRQAQSENNPPKRETQYRSHEAERFPHYSTPAAKTGGPHTAANQAFTRDTLLSAGGASTSGKHSHSTQPRLAARRCSANNHDSRRHPQPTVRPHTQTGHALPQTRKGGQLTHTRRNSVLTRIAAQRVTSPIYHSHAAQRASPTKGSGGSYAQGRSPTTITRPVTSATARTLPAKAKKTEH